VIITLVDYHIQPILLNFNTICKSAALCSKMPVSHLLDHGI